MNIQVFENKDILSPYPDMELVEDKLVNLWLIDSSMYKFTNNKNVGVLFCKFKS